jgi:hypothetical protein
MAYPFPYFKKHRGCQGLESEREAHWANLSFSFRVLAPGWRLFSGPKDRDPVGYDGPWRTVMQKGLR